MAYRVKWNGPRVVRNLVKEMSRRLRQGLVELQTQVRRNLSRSGRGFRGDGSAASSRPGEFPAAQRGILNRSIFWDQTDDLSGIVGVAKESPAAKYAARLEDGGVIRSHGKMMAVPISEKAKAHSYNGGPRTLGIPLVFIRRPGKVPLLVEIPKGSTADKPGKKAWTIHYVLTPKVTILARPFLVRTATEMQPRLKQIFEAPITDL